MCGVNSPSRAAVGDGVGPGILLVPEAGGRQAPTDRKRVIRDNGGGSVEGAARQPPLTCNTTHRQQFRRERNTEGRQSKRMCDKLHTS